VSRRCQIDQEHSVIDYKTQTCDPVCLIVVWLILVLCHDSTKVVYWDPSNCKSCVCQWCVGQCAFPKMDLVTS